LLYCRPLFLNWSAFMVGCMDCDVSEIIIQSHKVQAYKNIPASQEGFTLYCGIFCYNVS
jgi:hypothetical protein